VVQAQQAIRHASSGGGGGGGSSRPPIGSASGGARSGPGAGEEPGGLDGSLSTIGGGIGGSDSEATTDEQELPELSALSSSVGAELQAARAREAAAAREAASAKHECTLAQERCAAAERRVQLLEGQTARARAELAEQRHELDALSESSAAEVRSLKRKLQVTHCVRRALVHSPLRLSFPC
jgi:hypothetical protein